MLTRRLILTSGAAIGLGTALPALAQAPARANPMPDALRKSLERDPGAPVLGNPDGNITLTEFFDYNCPFCRKMVGVVQQAISADPQLRVIYHEWPVFGEGSEFAAQASLAALDQQKYWAFHAAMMAMKDRAEEASVMRIARQVGLDTTRLRRDMESQHVSDHLQLSQQLAEHMGLVGTPTFICGDEAAFGALTLTELQELIANGRKTLGVA